MAGFDKFGVARCCCGCALYDKRNNGIRTFYSQIAVNDESAITLDNNRFQINSDVEIQFKKEADLAFCFDCPTLEYLPHALGNSVIYHFYAEEEGEDGKLQVKCEYKDPGVPPLSPCFCTSVWQEGECIYSHTYRDDGRAIIYDYQKRSCWPIDLQTAFQTIYTETGEKFFYLGTYNGCVTKIPDSWVHNFIKMEITTSSAFSHGAGDEGFVHVYTPAITQTPLIANDDGPGFVIDEQQLPDRMTIDEYVNKYDYKKYCVPPTVRRPCLMEGDYAFTDPFHLEYTGFQNLRVDENNALGTYYIYPFSEYNGCKFNFRDYEWNGDSPSSNKATPKPQYSLYAEALGFSSSGGAVFSGRPGICRYGYNSRHGNHDGLLRTTPFRMHLGYTNDDREAVEVDILAIYWAQTVGSYDPLNTFNPVYDFRFRKIVELNDYGKISRSDLNDVFIPADDDTKSILGATAGITIRDGYANEPCYLMDAPTPISERTNRYRVTITAGYDLGGAPDNGACMGIPMGSFVVEVDNTGLSAITGPYNNGTARLSLNHLFIPGTSYNAYAGICGPIRAGQRYFFKATAGLDYIEAQTNCQLEGYIDLI